MGNNEKLLKIRVSNRLDFRKKTPFSGACTFRNCRSCLVKFKNLVTTLLLSTV